MKNYEFIVSTVWKYAVDILKFYPPVFCNPFLKSVTYLTNSKYFFHLKYLIELWSVENNETLGNLIVKSFLSSLFSQVIFLASET